MCHHRSGFGIDAIPDRLDPIFFRPTTRIGVNMTDLLSEYPAVIEFPIAWGDMDALQHVNNVVYFRHFESVRVKYLEMIDFLAIENTSGIGPILASTQCRYKIPLTYPDHVSVGAKLEQLGEDRFVMAYSTVSHRQNKVAAVGRGEVVAFDYRNNRKALIPEGVRTRITHIEKQILHAH